MTTKVATAENVQGSMYFDWWDGQSSVRRELTRFAAFYYNTMQENGKPTGVINYKDFAMVTRAFSKLREGNCNRA